MIDVTEDGIIVNDPFCKTDLLCRYKHKSDCYDGKKHDNTGIENTNENNVGANVLWAWDDVEKITFKYIEAYNLKP